ncbi:MAG: hypothetical protein AABZ39_14900, partial [Spirochaetota bacterium]
VRRIWGTLNAEGRYTPAYDVTDAVKGTKDADAIQKQPVVGQLAPRAFSTAELAKCNGRGGPKYIAYERIVYDFSKVKWGSRYHTPAALGRDNAPAFMRTCGECHGPDVFPQFPVVGVVTNAK